jgi:hypothetical protein
LVIRTKAIFLDTQVELRGCAPNENASGAIRYAYWHPTILELEFASQMYVPERPPYAIEQTYRTNAMKVSNGSGAPLQVR